MNAFEELVASCVAVEGYWTSIGHKVNLSKEQKVAIGLPSAPRWELDVIAYSPTRNVLRVIECKSYIDSGGVDHRDFDPTAKLSGRYKLFTRTLIWPVVKAQLVSELEKAGLILPRAEVRLGLAYGRTKDRKGLERLFADNGWELTPPDWLKDQLHRLAKGGWQKSTASIVAKLLIA